MFRTHSEQPPVRAGYHIHESDKTEQISLIKILGYLIITANTTQDEKELTQLEM
jgi:hypothetical protein